MRTSCVCPLRIALLQPRRPGYIYKAGLYCAVPPGRPLTSSPYGWSNMILSRPPLLACRLPAALALRGLRPSRFPCPAAILNRRYVCAFAYVRARSVHASLRTLPALPPASARAPSLEPAGVVKLGARGARHKRLARRREHLLEFGALPELSGARRAVGRQVARLRVQVRRKQSASNS